MVMAMALYVRQMLRSSVTSWDSVGGAIVHHHIINVSALQAQRSAGAYTTALPPLYQQVFLLINIDIIITSGAQIFPELCYRVTYCAVLIRYMLFVYFRNFSTFEYCTVIQYNI